MSEIIKQKILLFLILIIAVVLRFTGINWDQNHHLHPDERFLTLVGIDIQIPNTLGFYLDPQKSPLNPVNIIDGNNNKKYSFFVYGTFPLTLNKFLSVVTANDTYNGFTLAGRLLSGFADLFVILIIFKTVHLLEKKYNLNKNIKLWSAFFYTIAVLPIQLSHFFAVDSILNTALFSAFYFSLRFYFRKGIDNLVLCAILFAVAIGSKITAIFILPVLLILFFNARLQAVFKQKWNIKSFYSQNKIAVFQGFLTVILFLLLSYIALRFTNPYMFESPNFLNPSVSKLLVENWKTLKTWENEDVWFPPAVQWYTKTPVFFALKNLAVYGLGLPVFLLSIIGAGTLLRQKKYFPLLLTVFWVFAFFCYQSVQFTSSMRYFILIYPYLTIFAAFGLTYLTSHRSSVLKFSIVVLSLIWPLAFFSIYLQDHSRVQASEWIYQNIPVNSIIAWELWDDPLPLHLPGFQGMDYQFRELPVFDYDSPEKWKKINSALDSTDYYILSSNRAWGSIPTVPKKFPVSAKFYNDLLAGKSRFKLQKKVHVYPSLRYLGIPIDFPDTDAEEAFTVYDHPEVLIFKKDGVY